MAAIPTLARGRSKRAKRPNTAASCWARWGPAALHPERLVGIFNEVSHRVVSFGLRPAVRSPFPPDILEMIGRVDANNGPNWAQQSHAPLLFQPIAAGSGRGPMSHPPSIAVSSPSALQAL